MKEKQHIEDIKRHFKIEDYDEVYCTSILIMVKVGYKKYLKELIGGRFGIFYCHNGIEDLHGRCLNCDSKTQWFVWKDVLLR